MYSYAPITCNKTYVDVQTSCQKKRLTLTRTHVYIATDINDLLLWPSFYVWYSHIQMYKQKSWTLCTELTSFRHWLFGLR